MSNQKGFVSAWAEAITLIFGEVESSVSTFNGQPAEETSETLQALFRNEVQRKRQRWLPAKWIVVFLHSMVNQLKKHVKLYRLCISMSCSESNANFQSSGIQCSYIQWSTSRKSTWNLTISLKVNLLSHFFLINSYPSALNNPIERDHASLSDLLTLK